MCIYTYHRPFQRKYFMYLGMRKQTTNFNSIISSYGECCVDDVNASHSDKNDMIIHFGKCCLSTSSNYKPNKEILYVLNNSENLFN